MRMLHACVHLLKVGVHILRVCTYILVLRNLDFRVFIVLLFCLVLIVFLLSIDFTF